MAGKIQGDEEIQSIKEAITSGEASKSWTDKYLIHDDLIYYLSGKNEDVRLQLNVLQLIRGQVLRECYDQVGHLGVDKTYELISRKYYWPGIYKEVNKYVVVRLHSNNTIRKYTIFFLLSE